MNRIMAFQNPYADPEGIGYHAIQSLTAIANGEGFGRGLGFGIQKLGYLPEDRTDFVFAVLCEELGIPGAAMVVTLFGVLVWAGFLVMRRERNPMLRLMALGIISTVGVQACINLFVVTAMAPTKGIALPLISHGGTGWILTAFSLGLVVAIDRTQEQPVLTSGMSEAPKTTVEAMIEAKPQAEPATA
jgi:cell division protein FtsW